MNTSNNIANRTENQKFIDLLEIFEIEANIELSEIQKQKFFRVLELHTVNVIQEATSEMINALSIVKANNKKIVA